MFLEKIINSLKIFISFMIPIVLLLTVMILAVMIMILIGRYSEKIISFIGKFISLMIPVITLLMIVIIVARYSFGIGLTGLQELVMYIHALVFLGCAGYVHYKNEHVRVDIFYRNASNNYKSNVNFYMSLLFLLPVCFVVGFYSLDLIEMSWRIKEVSTEAGGLKYVYIQKTLIVLFPATLTLTFLYQLLSKKWN